MMRGGFVFVGLLVLMVGLGVAEQMINNGKVTYEKNILELYENNKFVNLIVYINESYDFERIVANFSEDEVRLIINRDVSLKMFSAEMTKDAFEKLIQNEEVESVYYNAPVEALSNQNNFVNIMFLSLIIIILLLILLCIVRRKKISKRK